MEAQNLYDEVLLLCGQFTTLLTDIVLASKGVVTPTLLPSAHLIKLIQHAVQEYHYKPVLPLDDIAHYYPLLHSDLFYRSIFIYIPFISDGHYSAFRVHKFPVSFDNQIYTADVDENQLIVVSPDNSYVAFPPRDILTLCQSSTKYIHVCPAYLFILEATSSSNHSPKIACALALATNMPIQDVCHYTPSKKRKATIVHAAGLYYLYFPTITKYISITCPSKSSNLKHLLGSFIVPDVCGVYFSNVKLLPTTTTQIMSKLHYYQVSLTILNASLSFQPIMTHNWTKIKNITIEPVDTTILDLPSFLLTHWDTPTAISVNVGILCIVLGVILVCLYCYCKMRRRVNVSLISTHTDTVHPNTRPRTKKTPKTAPSSSNTINKETTDSTL